MKPNSSKFLFFSLLSLAIISFVACDKEDNSSVDKLTPPFEIYKGNAKGSLKAIYREGPIAFHDYLEIREIFPNELGIEARNGNRILDIRFNQNSIDTVRQFRGTYENAQGKFNITPDEYFFLSKNNLDSNLIQGEFELSLSKMDSLGRSISVHLDSGLINLRYEGF